MTEQQIREQTQAVLDAYIGLNRSGISLTDFLEIRREAIHELSEVMSKETPDTVPTIKEKRKKWIQKEDEELSGRPGTQEKGGNKPLRKQKSAKKEEDTREADQTGADIPISVTETEEPAEEEPEESLDEYSDFLDDFNDPWN